VFSANPTTHEFCLPCTLHCHLCADISFTLGTLTLTGQRSACLPWHFYSSINYLPYGMCTSLDL